MWAICKTFHILPTDPALLQLTGFQKRWIVLNLCQDASQQSIAYGPKADNTQTESYGVNDEEFKSFTQQMRELAKEQASGRRT